MKSLPVDKEYWNIVKGLGIVFVVLGHVCWDLTNFIYLFHLPLFFFVSGFLYNEKKYGDDPYLNAGNRIKSSWIKYVLLYWILILLHNLMFTHDMLEDGAFLYSKKDLLIKLSEASLGMGKELMGGTLWFIPVLVIASCILGFTVTFSRRIYDISHRTWLKILFQAIVVFGMTYVGYVLEVKYIDLPAHMQISWVVMPFLWVGYLIRNYNIDFNKYLNLIFSIVCFVVLYIASKHYWLDLVFQSVYPYMHIVAFLGIYMCLYFAKVIRNIKIVNTVFETLGRASFWIMFIHFPLFKIFDWIYTVKFNNSNFEAYRVIPIAYRHLVPVYLFLGLGITTLIYVLFESIKDKLQRRKDLSVNI